MKRPSLPLLAIGLVCACAETTGTAEQNPPPPTGDISVVTATSGGGEDPDGYAAALDPGTSKERTLIMGSDETKAFTAVPTGSHVVELSQLADVCTVLGQNPLVVQVNKDALTVAEFDVECIPPVGTIRITNNTLGKILFVFFKKCGSGSWGIDRLPNHPVTGVIDVGASRDFTEEPGCWDLRADHKTGPNAEDPLETQTLLGQNLNAGQVFTWTLN